MFFYYSFRYSCATTIYELYPIIVFMIGWLVQAFSAAGESFLVHL